MSESGFSHQQQRILWIHAGGPKTGSSAIQSFLEFNDQALAKSEFAYRNKAGIRDEREICSGNGSHLYAAVTSKQSIESLAKLMLGYFGPYKKAICSAEHFVQLSVTEWRQLANAAEYANVTLKVLLFIRDALPFLASMYDQGIKQKGVHVEFVDYAAVRPWSHKNAARALAEVFTLEHLRVLHYDSLKGHLISTFADAIGLELSASVKGKYNDLQVNRSLTAAERHVLISINQRFGSRFSKHLSKFLIYTKPDLKTQPKTCSKELAHQLLEKYQDDIRFINRHFFDGQPVVSVGLGQEEQQSEDTPISCEEKSRILDALLEWSLLSLSEVETKIRRLTKVEQSAIEWQKRSWFTRAFRRWRPPEKIKTQ